MKRQKNLRYKTIFAFVLASLVYSGCFFFSNDRSNLGSELDKKIKIEISNLKAQVLEVSITIPMEWFSPEIENMEFIFSPLSLKNETRDYGEFIEFIDSKISRHNGKFKFFPQSKNIKLHYKVHLKAHELGPKSGLDDVSHPHPGGWFFIGRAFVPKIFINNGKTLDMPVSFTFSPEFGSIASSLSKPLEAENIHDAIESVFYTGTFSKRVITPNSLSLQIVSSYYSETELQPAIELIEKTVSRQTILLGSPRMHNVLVILERSKNGRDGGVIGQAITVISDGVPQKASLLPGTIIVHELTHLWHRGDPTWYGEGFTRYFEIRTKHYLDGSAENVVIAEFQKNQNDLNRLKRNQNIRNFTGADGYAAGTIIAFCLDKALSKRGSTLANVLKDANKSGKEYLQEQTFKDFLKQKYPDLMIHLEKWLDRSENLNISRC